MLSELIRRGALNNGGRRRVKELQVCVDIRMRACVSM